MTIALNPPISVFRCDFIDTADDVSQVLTDPEPFTIIVTDQGRVANDHHN
jgi:hypothetical protein